MQNGRTSLKNKKKHSAFSSQPSAFSQTNAETEYNRVWLESDAERGSAEAVIANGALKPTPFWDDLGCGGILREGEEYKISCVRMITDLAFGSRRRHQEKAAGGGD
jgi:hypothetical protein